MACLVEKISNVVYYLYVKSASDFLTIKLEVLAPKQLD